MRWLSLALLSGLLPAQLLSAEPASQVRLAVALGYSQQYDSARAVLTRVPAQDSLAPLVAFWQASMFQMLLYDSGDPVYADSFYEASERALAVCRARIKADPDDARAHLFFGLTQLNRANCLSWQRRRLRALRTLGSASNSLKRAADLDPTLADAWYGLGAVEYFRALADRHLLNLGLVGSSEKSHGLMARARTGDGWLTDALDFTLAFMHKEDGNHPKAVALCRRILEQYPDNRTALRLLRDSYLAAGEWHQTLAVCRQLESSINRSFPDNRYGLAENRLAALKAWHGLGQQDSVRVYADRLIAWSPWKDEVPWLSDYIAEARQFRRGLN